MALAAALSAQTPELEIRLKAAVVSKLPQFVEWPAEAMEGRSTVDVCVAAASPSARDLQDLLAGERLNGRSLTVRAVRGTAEVAACHVLYVAGADAPDTLLQAASASPVLTVGDAPRFLERGGIVALRTVQGKVRFEVDAGAAKRAGLRISSQLLRLALAVRGDAS